MLSPSSRVSKPMLSLSMVAALIAIAPAVRADGALPKGHPASTRPYGHAEGYDEPGTEIRSYPEVWIIGAWVFGAAWIGTVVMAGVAVPDEDQNQAIGHAFIPVGGPFYMIAQEDDSSDVDPALPAMGAAQGIGLVLTFVGATLERKVRVSTAATDARAIELEPQLGLGSVGLQGRF
jgi:hypothetical protein